MKYHCVLKICSNLPQNLSSLYIYTGFLASIVDPEIWGAQDSNQAPCFGVILDIYHFGQSFFHSLPFFNLKATHMGDGPTGETKM